MKYRIARTALLVLGLSVAGHSQSLGDLAKKEKERREKLKAETKVITNDDTPKYANSAVTTVSLPQPPAKDKEGLEGERGETQPGGAPGPKASPDEPTDFQGRPESFWRQTFSDARQRVKELENEANVLILKINELQTRFYNTDDGFQRQAVQREMQKSFYEQDRNKEELAKAKAMLEELEKEARKSGVLPGWFSGKTP